MAKTVNKIGAIAFMALQETLRRKVLYIVAILGFFAVAIVGSGLVVLRMATEAGELQAAENISSQFVQAVLGIWTSSGSFLAVFLGAVGISSEVSGRTIVNVLSRPVERAVYLVGRWFGIVIFLVAFQILGILIAMLIGGIFNVSFSASVWLGFLETFIRIVFYSGVSLAFSVIMPPVPAGASAMLITALPFLVSELTRNPRWLLRLPATAVYYLSPARMPVDLIGDSFSKQLLHPDYALYAQVLAENTLYAVAVFVVACAIFSRRELRLR